MDILRSDPFESPAWQGETHILIMDSRIMNPFLNSNMQKVGSCTSRISQHTITEMEDYLISVAFQTPQKTDGDRSSWATISSTSCSEVEDSLLLDLIAFDTAPTHLIGTKDCVFMSRDFHLFNTDVCFKSGVKKFEMVHWNPVALNDGIFLAFPYLERWTWPRSWPSSFYDPTEQRLHFLDITCLAASPLRQNTWI
jgi:hypothetical protein